MKRGPTVPPAGRRGPIGSRRCPRRPLGRRAAPRKQFGGYRKPHLPPRAEVLPEERLLYVPCPLLGAFSLAVLASSRTRHPRSLICTNHSTTSVLSSDLSTCSTNSDTCARLATCMHTIALRSLIFSHGDYVGLLSHNYNNALRYVCLPGCSAPRSACVCGRRKDARP